MGITRSTAAGRAPLRAHYFHPGEAGNRRLETVLLAAVSSVVILGLILVYGSKAAGLAQSAREIAGNQALNLNRLSASEDLLPYLGIFRNPEDRSFVAKRIYEFARAR